jgi:hypothetical protein
LAEPTFERVTLDTGVLLGARNREFLAAADLGYFRGYWSVWIAAEFARVRTEWIARRASRDLARPPDVKARLERSRGKVNAEVATLARVLTLVDYLPAAGAGLGWLTDEDDRPIMQTAIAAGVPGTLVTDNSRDFPLGEVRNGILLLGSAPFLEALYRGYPEAPAMIAAYLGREPSS